MTMATTNKQGPTLYEQMGGDFGVQNFMESLYEETLQNEEMKRLFQHSSIPVLISHQIKLYRVLFGPVDQRPDPNDVVDYMLMTHTRIFRDLGLNESHFDTIAKCFVEGLESMQAEQSVIDECLVLLGPLREVFAYGAKVAEQEKELSQDQKKTLPEASAKTMTTEDAVVLPEPPTLNTPDWLAETLAHHSDEPNVRAWTCALTTEFGEEDLDVADTFLAMPYMHHHVYALVLLQLAFLPKKDELEKQRLLKMIQYPQGEEEAPVCLSLWKKMQQGFVQTCQAMSLEEDHIRSASAKLQSYNQYFVDEPLVKVEGAKVPHLLSGKISPFQVVEASTATSTPQAPEEAPLKENHVKPPKRKSNGLLPKAFGRKLWRFMASSKTTKAQTPGRTG